MPDLRHPFSLHQGKTPTSKTILFAFWTRKRLKTRRKSFIIHNLQRFVACCVLGAAFAKYALEREE